MRTTTCRILASSHGALVALLLAASSCGGEVITSVDADVSAAADVASDDGVESDSVDTTAGWECITDDDCIDDGNRCNGVPGCVDHQCLEGVTAAVTCEPSTPCESVGCAPETGVCERTPVDPCVVFQRYADPNAAIRLGTVIALQGDVIAASSPRSQDMNYKHPDTISVWSRAAGQWSLEQTIVRDNGDVLDDFGGSLAVYGDVIATGADETALTDPFSVGAGAVHVYRRGPQGWASDAVFLGEPYQRLGRSVAIVEDRLVSGAPRNTAAQAGSVAQWSRSDLQWKAGPPVVSPNVASPNSFGQRIVMAADLLVVSDLSEPTTNGAQATVRVFAHSGGDWDAGTVLEPEATEVDGRYGEALAATGSFIAVGAHWEEDTGTVHVFERGDLGWSFTTRLRPTDDQDSWFGRSISASGDLLAVSALPGGIYVYEWAPEGWTQRFRVRCGAADKACSGFGSSVSLWGRTLAIGAGSSGGPEDVGLPPGGFFVVELPE